MPIALSNQCYFIPPNAAPVATDPYWVPCYNATEEFPYVPCCTIGSFCLEGNICAVSNVGDTAHWDANPHDSPYYTADCTDPNYSASDPACTTHCETEAYRTVKYDSNNGRWQCCGNATGSFCDEIADPEIFVLPQPAELKTLASLPAYYKPAITYAIQQASNPIVSELLTNSAKFRSDFSKLSLTAIPSGADPIDSAYYQDLLSGFPTTGVFTGPSALAPSLSRFIVGYVTPTTSMTTSTTPTPTSTPTTPTPTSTPTQHSSDHGAVIGGAVGGTLGGLLLIALAALAFILLRRRRRNKQAGVANGEAGPGLTPQMAMGGQYYDNPAYSQHHTSTSGSPPQKYAGTQYESVGDPRASQIGSDAGLSGQHNYPSMGATYMPSHGVDAVHELDIEGARTAENAEAAEMAATHRTE